MPIYKILNNFKTAMKYEFKLKAYSYFFFFFLHCNKIMLTYIISNNFKTVTKYEFKANSYLPFSFIIIIIIISLAYLHFGGGVGCSVYNEFA